MHHNINWNGNLNILQHAVVISWAPFVLVFSSQLLQKHMYVWHLLSIYTSNYSRTPYHPDIDSSIDISGDDEQGWNQTEAWTLGGSDAYSIGNQTLKPTALFRVKYFGRTP